MRGRIKRQLERLGSKVTSLPRRAFLDHSTWRDDVPSIAGVYVIWDGKSGQPVYVGETCQLKARFGDLSRTVNHTFRRRVAGLLQVDPSDDARLSLEISRRYSLSFLPLDYGRKELEEFLILKWSGSLLNKPARRLQGSKQYGGME